jgi:hypothetical protein
MEKNLKKIINVLKTAQTKNWSYCSHHIQAQSTFVGAWEIIRTDNYFIIEKNGVQICELRFDQDKNNLYWQNGDIQTLPIYKIWQ